MNSDYKRSFARQLLESTDNNLDQAIAALKEAATPPNRVVNRQYGGVVVEVIEATKEYKIGSRKVEALKGVTLQIHQGEFVALTGASGSGKSTLLQLIGGLDKPSSGSVIVDGHDIAKLCDRDLSKFRNKTIGFVFQFFFLQPFLNLATNVEVSAMFARIKPKLRHERSKDMITSVDLGDRIKHLPKELSGGQMQRVAIARALMNKPKLLLADEPTGNLDSKNAKAIFEHFESLRTEFNTTIIVVTHDQSLAHLADRVLNLSDGVLL